MTPPAVHGTGQTYPSARVGQPVERGSRWLRAPLATSSLLLSAALGMLPACSDDTGPAPLGAPVAGALDDLTVNPQLTRGCEAGQTQSCSLTLGEHDGVISCYEGTSTCSDGRYGPCQDGHEFTLERSDFGQRSSESSAQAGLHMLAISEEAVDCANNPCNRYCREFIETPGAGLTADPDTSAPPLVLWSEGGVGDYSPEALALGRQEPCQVASDCQLNSSCIDPSLGSCSHSVCSAGDALITGCNRCADTVCAIEPDCCGTQPACLHDPCDAQGAPLDANCDPCVAAVCAAHPECCDIAGSWNAACVGYIATECAPLGQSCGCPPGSEELNGKCYTLERKGLDFNTAAFGCNQLGTDWNLIQVDDEDENDAAERLVRNAGVSGAWLGGLASSVDSWMWRPSVQTFFVNDASGGALQAPFTYENFASGEPELGAAGLGLAMDSNGEWYGEDQSSELRYLCEGPRSFLDPRLPTFEWSPSCVALVENTCGVECPDAGVPVGTGTCEARLPTELSSNCASFDLAVGATCDDGSRPQIPVCNHGQSAAPTGLRLSYLPVSELRKATPDLSLGGDCNLSVTIPPGQCVVVDDCPGLTADSVLVVNPGGATQNASECRTDDNWSVYQQVKCGVPLCESGMYNMQQVANAGCTVPLQNPLNIDASLAQLNVQANIPEPHCQPGELLWGNSCYFRSSNIATWDRAELECTRRGADWHLVALNSPAENQWVRSQTDPLLDLQIGFSDEGDEGNHKWTNGSCRSYSNWDALTSQPNDFPGGGEQCSRMTATAIDAWEDTACGSDEHPYMCEGPVLDAQGACAAGESMGPDGNCYIFVPSATTAADASANCIDRGLGWDLAQIDTLQVNEFVTGLIGCTPSWIRGVEPTLTGFSVTVGDPFIDELGLWQSATDSTLRASVCRGPRTLTAPQGLTRVAGPAACTPGGDQFYFAGGPVAPEELTLCPDTCTAANALRNNRLRVAIPCAPPTPPVIATTHDERYSADCDGDGGVIWDFFYYDAVTPADSRIEFEIRTAPTLAELDANTIPFVPVAQAHAVPTDTQRCEIDPANNCPVDIFSKLGSPSQQYNELELRVKLIPGSSGEGPLLRDWRVRYSCPPSQ